jgi:hypothetical protein
MLWRSTCIISGVILWPWALLGTAVQKMILILVAIVGALAFGVPAQAAVTCTVVPSLCPPAPGGGGPHPVPEPVTLGVLAAGAAAAALAARKRRKK